jgi:hypothetical protein
VPRTVALTAQQQDPSPSPPRVAEGFLELGPRLTRVNGQASPLLGAATLLGLGDRWRAGGAGLFLLTPIDLEIPPPLPALDLHMGYGGVFLERSSRAAPPRGERAEGAGWHLRLLVGAGNAEVRDSGTGARQRSDNFVVVESTMSIQVPLARRVDGGLVAGYRWVAGVDGLGDIDAADLNGISVGLAVRLGPF